MCELLLMISSTKYEYLLSCRVIFNIQSIKILGIVTNITLTMIYLLLFNTRSIESDGKAFRKNSSSKTDDK